MPLDNIEVGHVFSGVPASSPLALSDDFARDVTRARSIALQTQRAARPRIPMASVTRGEVRLECFEINL